jgi:hypothetical protein
LCLPILVLDFEQYSISLLQWVLQYVQQGVEQKKAGAWWLIRLRLELLGRES